MPPPPLNPPLTHARPPAPLSLTRTKRYFASRSAWDHAVAVIPALGWARAYKRTFIVPDLLAGLSVAALVVPQGMSYAKLAGLPPVWGLCECVRGGRAREGRDAGARSAPPPPHISHAPPTPPHPSPPPPTHPPPAPPPCLPPRSPQMALSSPSACTPASAPAATWPSAPWPSPPSCSAPACPTPSRACPSRPTPTCRTTRRPRRPTTRPPSRWPSWRGSCTRPSASSAWAGSPTSCPTPSSAGS